jgi:hypothetical protein
MPTYHDNDPDDMQIDDDTPSGYSSDGTDDETMDSETCEIQNDLQEMFDTNAAHEPCDEASAVPEDDSDYDFYVASDAAPDSDVDFNLSDDPRPAHQKENAAHTTIDYAVKSIEPGMLLMPPMFTVTVPYPC